MDRYWQANAVLNPPAPPADNPGGFPANGNPATGITGTAPGQWWYHSITEELRNAIIALGVAPDFAQTDQLATALVSAFREAGADLSASGGSGLVGFTQAGDRAATRTALDKMRERVTVDDYFQSGDADYTDAFERAGLYLAGRGGGVILCPRPSYVATSITLRRYQVIEGRSGAYVELVQAAGANQDFVVSENFAALTGSGLDVASDARVPSWFGLRRVRINANRTSNISGRGVAFYGACIVLDDVMVFGAVSDGLYTEYATNVTAITDWAMQEEGYARNVVCRNNGGVGWRNRGPHNLHMDNVIACLNDDWGYMSEILAGVYNGAPTFVSVLHCYSNDMQWTQESGRARRNMYIGTNMSCGLLVVDGAQCEIRGSNTMIGLVKQYQGGQGGDSLILSGSYIQIGTHYGIMRNDGVSGGSAALRISGNFNQIGASNISGTLNLFDGVIITGVGNSIADLVAQNCRTGLTVTGSRNRVKGYLSNNLTSFTYQTPTDAYGGYNDMDLRINQTAAGSAYVSGSPPVTLKDTFNIIASGLSSGPLTTKAYFEIGALPVDTTDIQTVTAAHGLLYAPARKNVQLTMTGLTGGSVLEMAWGPRCSVVDATNVTIQYKCATAAPAGSQMSIASSVTLA